jgi:putative flavoprotein involved in K+ transport
VRARRPPTFQLIGTPQRSSIDLNTLQQEGVQLVGRLAGITDTGVAQFSGSQPNQCSLAGLKLGRLLGAVDAWATDHGLEQEIPQPWRPSPTIIEEEPPLTLDLAAGRDKTIIWATGYHPDYHWLHVPVLDLKGQIRHQGGVTDAPGLYVIGTKFLRRRKSTFIDGVGDDAYDLGCHLAQHLESLSVH